MSEYGKFTRNVFAEWLIDKGDDQSMRLKEHFEFIDLNKYKWPAIPDDIIDGASIPKIAWTLIGSPYVGNYRRSAALHDSLYINQHDNGSDDPRLAVDIVFYKGMRSDETSWLKAAIMYAAVRIFGKEYWDTKAYSTDTRQAENAFKKEIVPWLEDGENKTLIEIDKACEAFSSRNNIVM